MPPWSSCSDRNDLQRNFAIFAVPRQRLYRPRANSVDEGGVHAASGLFAKREREPLADKPGFCYGPL